MYKMRRFTSLVLALGFATTVMLSGCGKSEEPAGGATPTAAAKKTLDPYTIDWYMGASLTFKDQTVIEEEVAKHLKDKINVQLKLHLINWGEYFTKMQTLLATNEKVDIMWINQGNGFHNYVAREQLNDLTEAFPKYAPKLYKKMNPVFIEGAKVAGKLYGIPANKEVAQTYGISFIKKYLTKHNLDGSKVKTLEDLEPMLKTIKEKEPDVIPFFMKNTSSVTDPAFRYEHIGDTKVPGAIEIKSKDYKVINTVEQASQMATWKLARKWYLAGYINKDAATLKDQKPFDNGLTFTQGFSTGLSPFTDGKLPNGDDTVAYILMKYANGNSVLGSINMFPKSGKNLERTLMFVEEYGNDEYLANLINFGRKDIDYVVDNENPKHVKYPAGKAQKDVGYSLNAAWETGFDWFITYPQNSEPTNRNEYIKKFNEVNVTVSPILGFVFDTEPVKNEMAAIRNVYDQYAPTLNTGSVDPEEVAPKYLAALKQAGVDKVIAEKQKQLDEWVKKNNKK